MGSQNYTDKRVHPRIQPLASRVSIADTRPSTTSEPKSTIIHTPSTTHHAQCTLKHIPLPDSPEVYPLPDNQNTVFVPKIHSKRDVNRWAITPKNKPSPTRTTETDFPPSKPNLSSFAEGLLQASNPPTTKDQIDSSKVERKSSKSKTQYPPPNPAQILSKWEIEHTNSPPAEESWSDDSNPTPQP